MISLIFEELDGDKIMLPVTNTAFEEKKADDGSVYVIAYYNEEKFALKTSLNEISRLLNYALRANQIGGPIELKNLRGFSGV